MARAVLIAGPTAGGKSPAALDLAEEAERSGRGAWIVNADSMQVYDALRVLTARPAQADEARARHRLYGHVAAEAPYSVGAWLGDVQAVLKDAASEGALPIIVGGTGLYFKALTGGIAGIPAIPDEVRARWAERLEVEGAERLHAQLARKDPDTAARVRPSDAQRIVRALAVVDATGVGIGEWQRNARQPSLLAAEDVLRFVMEPDRATLYRRIEDRVERMVVAGALEEVEALLGRHVASGRPVMKAIGVAAFASVLRGETALDAAMAAVKMETRRYAKRQGTWFRHQLPDWSRIGG